MNTTDLYNTFRTQAVDTEAPYLWTADEVFQYMNEAQIMFCRLAGGIPDVQTPEVCKVRIAAGQEYADLHPSILTIRQARLGSTGREIALRNIFDDKTAGDDYGMVMQSAIGSKPGPVRAMVIGEQYDVCRWVSIPEADDEAHISVFRLPVVDLCDFDLPLEIRREHHYSLLYWMLHLAYSKPDAETIDKARSAENEARFREYCEIAHKEWERYNHKPRSMKYGGIGGVGDYGPTSIRRVW